jgi:hypothetical protein
MNKVARFRYKRWHHIANMLMPRLHGINVVWDNSGKEPEVMPVYIPFIRFLPGDGQLLIEIAAWSENALVILLFSQWPFVYWERGGGIELDIRRKDDEGNV